MSDKCINVLLIEDNLGDARLIQEFLAEVPSERFSLDIVHDLSSAKVSLKRGNIDIVLLDLHLPGTSGLDTFNMINAIVPNVPIVILSGMSDKALAEEAIAKGAQDYLIKGRIVGELVTRSIHYSIERKKREGAYTVLLESLKEAHDKLQTLSITDPLTGLCNRRGLQEKIFQYLKMAKRNK